MTATRPRALPTTLEIIEAIALKDPRRPAIHEGVHVMGHGQVYAMAYQCTRMLSDLGVARGDRVAVGTADFTLQLLILLAAETLGAATASFLPAGDSDAAALFEHVDWVVCDSTQATPARVRQVRIDQAFVDRMRVPLAEGPRPWAPLEPHEVQRITRTSGSAGGAKFMALTRQVQEFWVRNAADGDGCHEGSRLLLLAPLVLNSSFGRASRCLRAGACVLVCPPAEALALGPTEVFGLPAQFEAFLKALPTGARFPQPVQVMSVGGPMGPELRRHVAAVFGGRINNRYGSNETGGVAHDMDASGTGVLNPGAEVRILDEAGADLPVGELGRIAIRSPVMAQGYLGLPAETAAAFRDGWFVSGDVGAMVGPRRLCVLGRSDDLVNFGGIKVPAAQLEDAIRAHLPVDDCVVLATNLADGSTLGIALVPSAGADTSTFAQALQEALGEHILSVMVRMLLLPALPRLPNGKPDRKQLQLRLRQPEAG